MCANYKSPARIAFEKEFGSRYKPSQELPWEAEVFPGYLAPIIALREGEASLGAYEWGILPRGPSDPSFRKKYATFNARAETVAESRLYRKPWEEGRRCIIPAGWFVEWRGQKGHKQKLHIHEPGRTAMRIAGIWDTGAGGQETFTMLTVEPNEFMKAIHSRMVALLHQEHEEEWMSPDTAPEDALKLLRPFAGELRIDDSVQSGPKS